MRLARLPACALASLLVINWPLATEAYARQREPVSRAVCQNPLKERVFTRTELFFGLSKPDGSVISEEEFQSFIDHEVTPHFPEGITVLTGAGQFLSSTGVLAKEGAKLLVVLYRFNKKTNRAIERIRQRYTAIFQQESVLRADHRACVSF